MKFLIVLATLVYIAYDWASVKKNKDWPESLSATYYLWPKWIFPSVMTLVGFSLLPVWLEATEGSNLQFLSFLSCLSIIFIGCELIENSFIDGIRSWRSIRYRCDFWFSFQENQP